MYSPFAYTFSFEWNKTSYKKQGQSCALLRTYTAYILSSLSLYPIPTFTNLQQSPDRQYPFSIQFQQVFFTIRNVYIKLYTTKTCGTMNYTYFHFPHPIQARRSWSLSRHHHVCLAFQCIVWKQNVNKRLRNTKCNRLSSEFCSRIFSGARGFSALLVSEAIAECQERRAQQYPTQRNTWRLFEMDFVPFTANTGNIFGLRVVGFCYERLFWFVVVGKYYCSALSMRNESLFLFWYFQYLHL